MFAMAMKKRNDFPLKMKYEVIKTAEIEPKLSVRKLAEVFQCGRLKSARSGKKKDCETAL